MRITDVDVLPGAQVIRNQVPLYWTSYDYWKEYSSYVRMIKRPDREFIDILPRLGAFEVSAVIGGSIPKEGIDTWVDICFWSKY